MMSLACRHRKFIRGFCKMAQILRARKLDFAMLIRAYGTHRRKPNYYEILRISPSASPKEIREAFVKLSKEMHPDTSKRDSHKEFVAVNEAYSVLSKKRTKEEYDHNLKYGTYHNKSHYGSRSSSGVYTSYHGKEWEAYDKANGPPIYHPVPPNILLRSVAMCIALMAVGTVIQLLLVRHSVTFKRNCMLEESMQLEKEFEKIKKAVKDRTFDENVDIFMERVKQYEEQQKRLSGKR